MIEPGDAFFGLDRRGHLWLALSRPDRANRVALANVTTHRPGSFRHGSDCVLVQQHEHPFLTHESCIAYQFAALFSVDALQSANVEQREPFAPDTLLRIQEGALRAAQIRPDVARAVRNEIDTGRPDPATT